MVKEIIPNILEVITLMSDIVIVIVLGVLVYAYFSKNSDLRNSVVMPLRNNYLLLGLIVSLVATLGSLYYSEVMGYTPCLLCWYQRIFMYPQVFLFGIALWKNDKRVVRYSIALSLIGGLIALYHYTVQIGIFTTTACSAVGYSASCSDAFFTTFGYITIPMMAFTAFVLLLILGIARLKKY